MPIEIHKHWRVSMYVGPTLVRPVTDTLQHYGAVHVWGGTERVYWEVEAPTGSEARDDAQARVLALWPSAGFQVTVTGLVSSVEIKS
jgi:hypothetical protein